MSYVICDFMGDETLVSISENIVLKDINNFKFLISHSLPKKNSILLSLEHLDANYLYSMQGLHSNNKKFSLPIINEKKYLKYLECMQIFLTCFDRTDPLGMSMKDKVHYFWTLLGFYENYLNERSDISSIIFCNVPHMPWDILLFYIAKFNNLRTLFLRKTGIGGYLYIDEDFRPHKGKFTHSYTDVLTLKDDSKIKNISINNLKDMNFTKGQIGGSWNIKQSFVKKKIMDIAKFFGLSNTLTTLRIINEGRPLLSSEATEQTKQISTFAAYRYFSWFNYLSVHFSYISKLKKIKFYYKTISLKNIPNKKFIYVSLHLQPERSTNPEGGYFDDQALMIKIISKSIPKSWCVLIKEHPKQFKYDMRNIHARSLNFYKNIKRFNNVFFIDETFSQKELIKKSEITATVSGSVGWESLLERKPSLIFSENWHSQCASSRYVFDIKSTSQAIVDYVNMPKDKIEESVLDFIKKIAPNLVYGALNNNHVRFFIPPEDRELIIENVSNAILQRLEK
jgi:hypothetical protein